MENSKSKSDKQLFLKYNLKPALHKKLATLNYGSYS